MPLEKMPSGLREEIAPTEPLGLALRVMHNLEPGCSFLQLFCVHWAQGMGAALPLKLSRTHGVLASYVFTNR